MRKRPSSPLMRMEMRKFFTSLGLPLTGRAGPGLSPPLSASDTEVLAVRAEMFNRPLYQVGEGEEWTESLRGDMAERREARVDE